MAYAEVAGLPAVAGLWAPPADRCAVYALLGSSRQLSVGPGVDHGADDGGAVAPLAAGDPGPLRALAAGARDRGRRPVPAGRAGLRAGALADLLSRPVLVGYMAGRRRHHDRRPAGQGHRRRGGRATRPAELASFVTGLDAAHLRPTLTLAAVLLPVLSSATGCPPRWPVPLIAHAGRRRRGRRCLDLRGPRRRGGRRLPRARRAPALPAAGPRRLVALLLPAVGRRDRRLHGQHAHRPCVRRAQRRGRRRQPRSSCARRRQPRGRAAPRASRSAAAAAAPRSATRRAAAPSCTRWSPSRGRRRRCSRSAGRCSPPSRRPRWARSSSTPRCG